MHTVPTNEQRRDQERQRLQRQLTDRRARQARRRRMGTIGGVAGGVVVVAAVVAIVLVVAHGSGSSSKQASGSGATPSSTAPTSAATSAAQTTCGQQQTAPEKTYPKATGASVSFDGVTVKGATDTAGEPTVTSKASTTPGKLEYKDLVVGKGQAASPSSCVTVQYVGVLYKTGTVFDTSWSRTELQGKGQATQFSLAQVVKGFTEGIGGGSGISPMKVGGRRIIILPPALGYGSQANGPIPANSPLVFVVDLQKVS